MTMVPPALPAPDQAWKRVPMSRRIWATAASGEMGLSSGYSPKRRMMASSRARLRISWLIICSRRSSSATTEASTRESSTSTVAVARYKSGRLHTRVTPAAATSVNTIAASHFLRDQTSRANSVKWASSAPACIGCPLQLVDGTGQQSEQDRVVDDLSAWAPVQLAVLDAELVGAGERQMTAQVPGELQARPVYGGFQRLPARPKHAGTGRHRECPVEGARECRAQA